MGVADAAPVALRPPEGGWVNATDLFDPGVSSCPGFGCTPGSTRPLLRQITSGPEVLTYKISLPELPQVLGNSVYSVLLGRDGFAMSPGRAHRLWRVAKLQVPRKRPRKRIASSRPRPQTPVGPNQVWAFDFVFDACADGRQLKCLTVADEFTKEGLAIEVDGRIRSGRVIEVLSRLVSERGAPKHLRSDNGPEFVSRALLKWIVDQGIDTALIEPGKPWQNGVNESFNGKFRDECLSLEWFRSRAEAKIVIENWRRHYNTVRPHSSLDYQTPAEFAAKLKEQSFSVHAGNGPGRCGTWGLRAPARCSTAPQGASGTTSKGCRLKLKLVRRNRAGHWRLVIA